MKIWNVAPIMDAEKDQDPDTRRHLCTMSLHNGAPTADVRMALNHRQQKHFVLIDLSGQNRSGTLRKMVQWRRQISGDWIRRPDCDDLAVG